MTVSPCTILHGQCYVAMVKKKKTKSQDSPPKAAPSERKQDVSVKDSRDESKTEEEESPYGGMDLRNFKKNLGCGG